MILRWLHLCVLLALPTLTVAAPSPVRDNIFLFEGSEVAGKGEFIPESGLANWMVRQLNPDERAELDNCLQQLNLGQRNYRPLLRAVRLPTMHKSALYFVRPALKPWCGALYGAHLFHYFMVEQTQQHGVVRRQLLFRNGGDFFEARRTMHHGFPDLLLSGFDSSGMWVTHMRYNGRRYQRVQCGRIFGDANRERRVKCW